MTITKRDTRWYDENYNSWDTKESATLHSPTLTDCRWCRGCSDCRRCSNCRYCSDCNACSGCNGCRDCYNCSNCIDCRDCNGCSDCSSCRDCIYCSSCSNISSENDKSWFKSMYYGDEVNKEIRPELDINNRKLDLDL